MTLKALRTLGLTIGMGIALSGCAGIGGGFGPVAGAQDRSQVSETEAVAEAALAGGNYEDAARLYEKAIEDDQNSASAYLGLGQAYMQLGQLARAEFALRRANELDHRSPEVFNAQAALKLEQLHPAEAITLYDKALARDRKNLSALTGKAVALDFLSRHSEAQAIYQEALRQYPTNFVLLSNYALSQALSGQVGAGLKIMQELLRDPEMGDSVRGNMAIAYALDGRTREARAVLEGTMSSSEIEETLAGYAEIRRRFQKGEPIGYLIFN